MWETSDHVNANVCKRLGADRIYDIAWTFPLALDMGCGKSHIAENLSKDVVEQMFLSDISNASLRLNRQSEMPTHCMMADEDFLPFQENTSDLVVSNLSLHWINDVPGALRQVHRVLKPDGVFVGAMVGGVTLYELFPAAHRVGRVGHAHCFQCARIQITDSLFFIATFIDVDEIQVHYPGMFEIMSDLQGEMSQKCLDTWNMKPMLHRDTILAVAAIYKEMYGSEDGFVPATFDILFMIGWKPHESQRGHVVCRFGKIRSQTSINTDKSDTS
ncbi:arginine-hydroxylase NDUFAF5, mitochondrial-like [Silurus meridionalis]|uniref:arginine-hydroxylase NDUFAF5, mitochondrial-like n=1 Tax=Silurus meridionalis TaxID=175797 RepID=UPI001EEC13BF|nr:arginine-hydroxylase NDUFAF5, mitochondrial-like [Silurus meridionalis]